MHLDISAVKEPGVYTGYIRKKVFFLGACTAVLALLAFISVGVGSVMIPFSDVVRTLVFHSSGNTEMIIWN
ncbi:MAG: iron ABC transporter permease, partial [Methanoregulaceae archaeon]